MIKDMADRYGVSKSEIIQYIVLRKIKDPPGNFFNDLNVGHQNEFKFDADNEK